jgi:hypothetical protein
METLTWSAFIALLISSIISYLFQRRINAHVYKLEQQLLTQQHENERLLKKLDFEFQLRQKAQIVAELFAKWAAPGQLTDERITELNKLSYECSLWLPQKIMDDLHLRLTNSKEAKQLQEILVDVRQYLNPEIELLNWKTIVFWKKKK